MTDQWKNLQMLRSRWRVAGLAFLCIVGCSGESGPATTQVTGRVTQAGAPIEGATVLFHPAKPGEGIKTGSGETDADGNFELQSHVEGTTYKSGVQPADYLVSVEKLDRSQVHQTMAPPKSLLPDKYRSPQTSELTATVVAGEENTFTFELE